MRVARSAQARAPITIKDAAAVVASSSSALQALWFRPRERSDTLSVSMDTLPVPYRYPISYPMRGVKMPEVARCERGFTYTLL